MLSKHKDILVLAARIIIGGIFIFAGWVKISDMATTLGYFSQMGINPFWTYVTAYAELLGGIAVILGLYIEFAAGLLSIVMIVAIYKSRAMGFQGFMPPLAILAALLVLIADAGKFAAGSNLHKRNKTVQQ